MATLNFSFAGESIHAARLEPRVKKFDLEFENPALSGLKSGTGFSIEYFFNINKYAENMSEAFHLAAKELGVTIEWLGITLTGNLDSSQGIPDSKSSRFNTVDVALSIVSDASDKALEAALQLANELNPIQESFKGKIQFHFSLNAIVHLN